MLTEYQKVLRLQVGALIKQLHSRLATDPQQEIGLSLVQSMMSAFTTVRYHRMRLNVYITLEQPHTFLPPFALTPLLQPVSSVTGPFLVKKNPPHPIIVFGI